MSDLNIVFAVPKGRILTELMPILQKVGITPEADFTNDSSRKLQFATNVPNLTLIRARSFDVATFVATGAAHMGVAGNDVLMEFDYPEIYAPVDLKIGLCRLSLCQKQEEKPIDLASLSHVRVASKFPNSTRRYFAEHGIQAECVQLSGAMELAPLLNMAPVMVDLVATGGTLKANKLVEIAKIADVSSRLIVNRIAYKTHQKAIAPWLERFRKAVA